ncbi:hypothetical protein [Sphingomicrobium sediminis]|uniref:Uncharacterized protein n=1 Tax=Sphingomicrobium sediminis TaxID=2950949 RepID=A0A9X2J3E9_9SPHN|nr:hypothetical protein [Sphingomicrobium sediminis]MCM8557231.1 hypothetical protein [Sphingomicrobium sediminis]
MNRIHVVTTAILAALPVTSMIGTVGASQQSTNLSAREVADCRELAGRELVLSHWKNEVTSMQSRPAQSDQGVADFIRLRDAYNGSANAYTSFRNRYISQCGSKSMSRQLWTEMCQGAQDQFCTSFNP